MSKKTIRTGIVGSGFSASFHFEALRKVYGTNVEVVGVHSRNRERRHGLRPRSEASASSTASTPCWTRSTRFTSARRRWPTSRSSLAGLRRDKFVICEKPLTGYFGDGSKDFHWDRADKQAALDAALASIRRMLAAERRSKGRLLYAENWVYAPAVQKEREILEKTGGQILWIHGEEAHSGSHSVDYAYAARCGGGVLIGKGCHPLTAALYLKRVEGRTRDGVPIRPKTVSARTHAITRLPGFRDEGHIRRDYYDIDDFSLMHVEFDDGTLADVFASDIVLGGIHNCARGLRQQPPRALQHQSEHGHADVQSGGEELRRRLRGREDRHQAGLGLHVARRGLVHRLPAGDRGVLSHDRLRRPAGERQPAGRRRHFDDLQRVRFGRAARSGRADRVPSCFG